MNGVILGRFMPPHHGHLYLADFARSMVDHLYVLVCTLASEPIPGELRYRWMRELQPECTVIHITEEIPEARRGEAGATTIWAEAIERAIPERIDRVFASEEYGWDLAYRLDAQFVPVDPGRHNIPVSATEIREDPFRHWHFIPAPVRPWFVRHVALIDQSDLARELAEALNTVVAHPYGEFWQLTWNTYGGRRDATPIPPEEIQRGARATVSALTRRANRILLHDLRRTTDLDDLAPDASPVVIVADNRGQEELARYYSTTSRGGASPLVIGPHQATAAELLAVTASL